MYWYLTLNNTYPKNRRLAVRLIKSKYAVFALVIEADISAIKTCQLIFLGVGLYNDRHIQKALTSALKRIKH